MSVPFDPRISLFVTKKTKVAVYNFSFLLDIYIYAYVCIKQGEGNGNPLQYSCLENPRDIGAWWVAVHRVAQSRTRLK